MVPLDPRKESEESFMRTYRRRPSSSRIERLLRSMAKAPGLVRQPQFHVDLTLDADVILGPTRLR